MRTPCASTHLILPKSKKEKVSLPRAILFIKLKPRSLSFFGLGTFICTLSNHHHNYNPQNVLSWWVLLTQQNDCKNCNQNFSGDPQSEYKVPRSSIYHAKVRTSGGWGWKVERLEGAQLPGSHGLIWPKFGLSHFWISRQTLSNSRWWANFWWVSFIPVFYFYETWCNHGQDSIWGYVT